MGTDRQPSWDIERSNDPARDARKLAYRCQELVAAHRASFIERYLEVDGHIVIRNIRWRAGQYGFLIEARRPVVELCALDTGAKRYRMWNNPRHEETAVFPGQIEIVEGAKHVIPSRIWLQVFDDSLVDLGKPLYLFQSGIHTTAGRSVKLSLAFPDREVSAGGVGMAVTSGKGASENVETASDAMNDGAGFCDDDWVNGPEFGEAIQLFSRVRIGVYPDGIGLLPSPLNDAFHQNWDLGYGPIDGGLSIK